MKGEVGWLEWGLRYGDEYWDVVGIRSEGEGKLWGYEIWMGWVWGGVG